MEYGSASCIASVFLQRLVCVYYNLRRKWHIDLYNTLKTRYPAWIWKICWWVHILEGNYRSCIAIFMALVLDGSLHYVQSVPYPEILQIFLLICMIWYCWKFRLPCPNDKGYYGVDFDGRFSYQLAMFEFRLLKGLSWLLHAHNKYEKDTVKIIPALGRISCCFAGYDTVEFIRLPCPNDKRYDDAIFADRFLYQLTMFEFRLLIGLSWFLPARNAYETDISKIIAQFCRISYCFAWFDTVEFSCLPCPNNKMYDDVVSLIDSDINWLRTKRIYW